MGYKGGLGEGEETGLHLVPGCGCRTWGSLAAEAAEIRFPLSNSR